MSQPLLDLPTRLRTQSLLVATSTFAVLFGIGSVITLRQFITGVEPQAFLLPFGVSTCCLIAWGLVRRGYEQGARRLFVITMLMYLGTLMFLGPFLLKFGIGFPLSVLTVFLFHLTHPPGAAVRLGLVLLAMLGLGFLSQVIIDIDVLMDSHVITGILAQVLVLGFSTLVLGRLGRGWTYALAEADQARRQLVEANQLANQSSRAKTRFLAAMSHELRTPLNAVIGYTELIEEELDLDNSVNRSDLSRIASAGHHLLGLVNQVLDLSRIEEGRLELHPQSVALDRLVKGVADMLGPRIAEGGNRLVLDVEPVSPLQLDQLRVRQIITNLLGNAAKFTERGTIAVRVEQMPNGRQRVSVRDEGPGIPHEHLERIFDPFEQASPEVQVTHGGTGLGLAISRRLAQQMRGRLWAESQLGHGSTFIFEVGDSASSSSATWTSPAPSASTSPGARR